MDHFTFLYGRDSFGRYWGYIHELYIEVEAPNMEKLTLIAITTIQQTTGENDPKLTFVNTDAGV